MKKCLIITAFYSYDYNVRIRFIEELLGQRGYMVHILSSDYDHRYKQYKSFEKENLKLIHVPEYKSNISFSRIYSHYIFAKGMAEYCFAHQYDMVYAITPPNFMFYYLSKVKFAFPQSKIVVEFEDLWPETLPINRRLRKILSPALLIWKMLRKKWMNFADGYVFECKMFMKALVPELDIKSVVDYIYMTRNDDHYLLPPRTDNSCLNFLYLGSIGNLIDIDLIVNFLQEVKIKKNVSLTIVGNGEEKDKLLKKCSEAGIQYIDYGYVFDPTDLKKIIDDCDLGLNIMKDSVFVGATMKSLEYFHFGLGIVNNIKGDTMEMIDNYHCGYNIDADNIKQIAEMMISSSSKDLSQMRVQSRKVYNENFSPQCFNKKFSEFVEKLMS